MKLSWKLLNELINLNNIKSSDFQEKLTLSGIEINEVKEDYEIQDKLINLNITANRKELYSSINLAKEISIIFSVPLKVKPINLKYVKNNTQIINLSQKIFYLKLNFITNIKKNQSPKWLINYLNACHVKSNDLFSDIQNYIQIKWGHKINILPANNIEQQLIDLNIISLQNNLGNENFKQQKTFFKTNNFKILIIYIHKHKDTTYYAEYFTNAYNETIKIISTYTKATIGKSYEQWSKTKNLEYILEIKKNKINKTLGTVKNKAFNFLSTTDILNTLDKLNFYPKYLKNLKIFKVSIPAYRLHDLKRDIDIIEEIGKIYGFKYFLSSLVLNKQKGSTSINYLQRKKIRHLLRNLGFNEVINCSLIDTKNNLSKSRPIILYNPITKEQEALRSNIIENLLENFRHNIKHKNFRIEIFEIGKVFEKNIKKQYIEKTNLALLFSNSNFTRRKWSDKPQIITWFQAKGIIETLLEQLNVEVILKKICPKDNKACITKNNYLFHPMKKVGIYNSYNEELIGIFGELSKKYDVKLNNNTIYIFEINIEKLNRTIKTNKNLNFSIEKYSPYPSVTRDISIKINKYKSINNIKKFILEKNKTLIESVEIFNEYYDKSSNSRFVGLRIIYRANNRTLNNKDIKNIDINIQNLLNELKTV
uniref:phenylalanine--tRNA ligase n=1 Tax=Bostrychia tenella TaxID=324755 RepID=A0A1Z1M5N5_9FLOR|nr:Phenylalanine-tRNA ligase beta subunit [Bostrychia tenella]ARW61339.1 Phenylalanine-tRNA ligase beta subunit [Bostrychia tenella]